MNGTWFYFGPATTGMYCSFCDHSTYKTKKTVIYCGEEAHLLSGGTAVNTFVSAAELIS